MRFDVADRPRIDTRIGIGGPKQVRLRLCVGSGQGIGMPTVIDRSSADETKDGITVALRIRELADEEHSNALTANIPVRPGREGLAAAIGRKHACLGEVDMRFRRQNGVDAPHERHVAIPCPDRLNRPVKSDQRTRASGFNRLARPVQIKKITDAVRPHRGHGAGRHIALAAAVGTDHLAIAARRCTHEDADLLPGQAVGRMPRVLDGLPGMGQHETLLRVHQPGFAGRDAEEQRIELIDPVDEATPMNVGLGWLLPRISVKLAP